ncbi:hypothetical protein [Microbulbifer discodermiae]|uniref:hypothetical protein n=1 Tax=Microbulbifer sp. 2201CG32-9 TaxID=3232309 RepID=UPI00345BC20B
MTEKRISQKELDKLEHLIDKVLPKELKAWLADQAEKRVVLTYTSKARTGQIVSGYKTIYNRYNRLLNNAKKAAKYKAVEGLIFLGHEPDAQDLGYFYLDPTSMEVFEFSDYCEEIENIGYFKTIFSS